MSLIAATRRESAGLQNIVTVAAIRRNFRGFAAANRSMRRCAAAAAAPAPHDRKRSITNVASSAEYARFPRQFAILS
ncbi:MAG TPA: hypothetical protein VGC77_01925 [Rhodopseudomonas sp.]